MYNQLIAHVNTHVKLDANDISLGESYFTRLNCPGEHILIEAGSIAANLYFVAEGYLRTSYKAGTDEVVTQLAGAGAFTTAFHSYVSQHSSREAVICITDCRLLAIDKKKLDQLYAASRGWASFIRLVYRQMIEQNENRDANFYNVDDRLRIDTLQKQFPEIITAVPARFIASYLRIPADRFSRYLQD